MITLVRLLLWLLLFGSSVVRAEATCDRQTADAIWQATHSRLQALLGETVPAPQMLLYPDIRDLPEADDKALFGYYDGEGQVLHVACQNGGTDLLAVALRHEATHHYLIQAFAPLPRWLHEGIATYMEAWDTYTGAAAFHINKPRLNEFVQMLQRGKAPSLQRLLAQETGSHNASQDYAAYWALIYALIHHPDAGIQQQRRQLLRELLIEPPSDPLALRQRLIDGLLRESPSLADWELRWRRQIWDLRQWSE